MKNTMKKIVLSFFIAAVLCAGSFAATINIDRGYRTLDWGSTVNDAQEEGYRLSILPADNPTAKIIQKLFSEKVDVYFVKPSEKKVAELYFTYYKALLSKIKEGTV